METKVLDGAQIGEKFITAAGAMVTLVRIRDDNGEYRYCMRGHDYTSYHNAEGRTPLNYDPGSYVVRKYVDPKVAYAEVPIPR
jgi:carbonic anhydrase/acetyltransferase-like protein (isoleucine patch superfamily)